MTDKRISRLNDILKQLPGEQRQALLEFAEFLVARHGIQDEIAEPLDIARPEKESVIQAIKRLSATYPMLEKEKLLSETGDLMTQHVMQNRDAVEIIDRLEILFQTHYQRHKS